MTREIKWNNIPGEDWRTVDFPHWLDENKLYCHFWEDEVIYKILKIKSGSRIIDESYEVRAGAKSLYDNAVIWIPIKDV